MASSRRQSNGRSPLVNQQRQITSFFSKTNSHSPSPSPSPVLAKQASKLNPSPKSNRSPSKSPSPSPPTPSPLQSKLKKPLLVIGETPSPTHSTPADKSYGKEVVEKRIRVYWPLDKAWYEGVVKSFDKESGKHLIQYDDDEEEELDLGKEKIEWVQESTRRLKRLRRGVASSAFKKVVIDEDEAENVKETSDDSSDEDWGKNVEKEMSEDAEEEDMDLDDEKEEEEEEEELEEDEEEKKITKRKGGGKIESKKRKASGGGGKLESGKKSKTSANASKEEYKVSLVETVKKIESK